MEEAASIAESIGLPVPAAVPRIEVNIVVSKPMGIALSVRHHHGSPSSPNSPIGHDHVVDVIDPGSAASASGVLLYDVIVRINGADVTTLEQDEVMELVRAAPSPLELTVSRGRGLPVGLEPGMSGAEKSGLHSVVQQRMLAEKMFAKRFLQLTQQPQALRRVAPVGDMDAVRR